MTTYCANGAKGCGDTYTCNTCRPPSATENSQAMTTDFAIAQLRHLYRQMLDGSARDTYGAAKGLLGPAIEALEQDLEPWSDKPLPEDDAINAAFPTRSGQHETYGEAMRLVSARHSKSKLVALVNWLLVERRVVRPVPDGLPGEIDVVVDGHSHHFVPRSALDDATARAMKAEAERDDARLERELLRTALLEEVLREP